MTLVAVPVVAVVGEFDATRPDVEVTSSGPIEWRVLDDDQAPPVAEIVEALLERATRALDDLADIDLTELDADTAETVVLGTERLRRTAEAATIRIAGHVDRVQPFRLAGFFTATAYLKHRLQLSGAEAFQRVQMARQANVLERWAAGHAAGAIGHAQFRLMARIATNPRIAPEQLQTGSVELWCDALDCSFVEFERRARMWEALADPVGALERAERAVQRRSVNLTPLLSGGWGLTGRLPDVGGAEFNEIFAHFVDVEWRNDWREATERLGLAPATIPTIPTMPATNPTSTGSRVEPTVSDLRRSEEHRRCDALVAMARAAAANGSGVAAEPTVNFIIDHDTARSIILDQPIDPARYRTVIARTDAGHPVHPRHIVNCALWAHVRRVVTDATSVVIDLGRRSRLFTGPAREAVMLLEAECVWIGCNRPTGWCDADHSVGWKAHGSTVPRNGGPLCRAHNVVKEEGYRVVRSPDGTWHTYRPNGDEIL